MATSCTDGCSTTLAPLQRRREGHGVEGRSVGSVERVDERPLEPRAVVHERIARPWLGPADEGVEALAEVAQRERRGWVRGQIGLAQRTEAIVAEEMMDGDEVFLHPADVPEPELLAIDLELLHGREANPLRHDAFGRS
jgi:hypothetical protein